MTATTNSTTTPHDDSAAENTTTGQATDTAKAETSTTGTSATGSATTGAGASCDEGERSLVDEVRKIVVNSGYAAVGLTDMAVSRAANTRDRVVAAREELKGRTVVGEVRKVRDAVAAVPGNMIASGVSLAEDAEHRVEALTERGRGAAGRVVSAEPASTIIDQATNVVDAGREVLAASPLAKVVPESMLKTRQATGEVLEGDVKPAKSLRDAVMDLVTTARKVATQENHGLSDITVPVEPTDKTAADSAASGTQKSADTTSETTAADTEATDAKATDAKGAKAASKTATSKSSSTKPAPKKAVTKSTTTKSTTKTTAAKSTASKTATAKTSASKTTTSKAGKTKDTTTASATQQKLADVDAALAAEEKADDTSA